MSSVSSITGWSLLLTALGLSVYLVSSLAMVTGQYFLPALGFIAGVTGHQNSFTNRSSTNWYPPKQTQLENLERVIHGSGVYGFIFNDSYAPPSNTYYGGYNWCNMPHVNQQTYSPALAQYELEYVEVIHRHHKRTPYAANTFTREGYSWNCHDEGLFYYGKPLNPSGNSSSTTYWSIYTSQSNPFTAQGFNGTCHFPQITRGGLDDSSQHGSDLYSVYHDLLHFLPDELNDEVTFRVTNNVITSQVAGMVVHAMHGAEAFPLSIQHKSVDSLEPAYACEAAGALYSSFGVGSNNPNWTAHLSASQPLFKYLDHLSGVSPTDPEFHNSWDHYFDNLSSRLCHDKPLPCKIDDPTVCANQSVAEEVFRLGQYEYSYLYRGAPRSLEASTASFGVWIAEMSQNIRDKMSGASQVVYRHNVAHDGSLAMLLSIMQVDEMVWPGMGAEVVFEVFRKTEERFVRVMWGGTVLRSSHPDLGAIDMLPLNTLLKYFDDLVGVRADKVPALCRE